MLDVYLVAWLVPGIAFGVLTELWVTGAVPVLTRVRVERGSGSMACTAAALFFSTGAVAGLFSVLGIAFSRQYVALTAPGFSLSDIEHAAQLSRILFPLMAVGSLVGVSTAALNSAHRFFIPSFTPVLQNIVVVVAVLGLGRKYGVATLAYGFLIGASVQLFVQLIHMDVASYVSREMWGHMRDEFANVRRTWALAGIAAIVCSLNQLTMVTQRFFASELAPGSISILYYGSVVMIALATIVSVLPAVFYPRFVEIFTHSPSEFSAFLSRSLLILFLFTIPLATYIAILPTPLVLVLFERGAFSHAQAARTAAVLRAFAPALAVGASTVTMARAFYATGKSRSLIYLGVLIVAVHFSISYLLAHRMGEVGLALATTAAWGVYLAGMMVVLNISAGIRFGSLLWSEIGRIVAACTVSGILMFSLARLFDMNSVAVSTLQAILRLVFSTSLFSLVYIAVCYICGVREIRLASSALLQWGRKQLHVRVVQG